MKLDVLNVEINNLTYKDQSIVMIGKLWIEWRNKVKWNFDLIISGILIVLSACSLYISFVFINEIKGDNFFIISICFFILASQRMDYYYLTKKIEQMEE